MAEPVDLGTDGFIGSGGEGADDDFRVGDGFGVIEEFLGGGFEVEAGGFFELFFYFFFLVEQVFKPVGDLLAGGLDEGGGLLEFI